MSYGTEYIPEECPDCEGEGCFICGGTGELCACCGEDDYNCFCGDEDA